MRSLLAAIAVCSFACAERGSSPVADTGPVEAPPDAGAGSADAGIGDTGPVPADFRIEVTIDTPRLEVPERGQASAVGINGEGMTFEITRAAAWHSSSSTTVEVFGGGGYTARGDGVAEIWASRGGVESNRVRVTVGTDESPVVGGELRGVWVTRWTFSSAADVQRIVDDVERGNLNAIFFQVRGAADAYYQSSHEPWAARLTGTLGQDPGWDPLGEIVRVAGARGIQVHAWLNTFPAWSADVMPTESTPRHVLLEHPEWICADANGVPMPLGAEPYQFLSPGVPAVRAHIADVAEDLITRYALDGIHFDYVRYPGRSYCHDATSEAEYADAQRTDPNLSFADFQRSRITLLLEDVQARIARVRPAVALTVASWGIHTNDFGWSSVSQGYHDYFQDAHRWAEEGVVDALCPMVYWRLTTPEGGRTDFLTLARDHVASTALGGRYTFLGMNADLGLEELEAQVRVARENGARGMVFFDLTQLRPHLDQLATGVFSILEVPPAMPWK